MELAVGQRRDARPRPTFGVVDDLRRGRPQTVRADPPGKLRQAADTKLVGGLLGAEVGAPLGWLAHA